MLSAPRSLRDLKGRIILPADADYDDARTVFAGAVDRRPALIARVADADDVALVVAYARETGSELAIRGGGHSAAGHGVSEGGVVLDMSAMRALELDTEARTAWAGAGLTAREYTNAAGEHGLATGFGDTGSVGIVGLTLTGGVGLLVRKHGLTIDDVLAVELVTADGELLRADADEHPDLFWALRGGGGNFGVVTRIAFRLHEVGTVVGGMLFLPGTPDVIAGVIAAAEEAPDELTAIVNVMPAPPLPFLAAEHHGKLVVMAVLTYAGDVADGERAVAPFRALAEPLADLVRPMAYPEMYMPEDESFRPIPVGRGLFVDHVDRRTAETIVERIEASTAMMALTQLRVLGGAVARVPADATAYPHRRSRIMAYVAAMAATPDELPQHEPWVRDLAAELAESGATYAGFLADEGEERVRAAYPGATWDRLRRVKAQYDPENVFRLNQNIPPA